ncbi:MAG: DUF2510 domain-containing protein [Acidimicrobiia bacterium]|nr:DUF2510 domain-containing protein [Acidimicrobiia bacterium]
MERDDDATLAGWHRDPSGRHELRFWDGTRWTEHVVSEGIPGHDHPTRSGRPPATASGTTPAPAPPTPADTAPPATDAATPEPEPEPAPEPEVEEPATVVDLVGMETPPVEAASDPTPAPAAPAAPADPGRATDAAPKPRRARAGTVSPAPARAQADTEVEPAEPEGTAATAPEPDPEPAHETSTPPPPPKPRPGPQPTRATLPRLVAEPPTVASPAGRSSGTNTSAIADPHRFETTEPATGRVAGVTPVPVKRYRPGSPPASPYVRPRPIAGSAPIGMVVTPWYRKASGWVTLLLIAAIVGTVVIVAIALTNDNPSRRLGSRPPAAAPAGTKVIDGSGVGIAAPQKWIVATDPGNSFSALRRANWGTPLVATDSSTGEALLVVPLQNLAHDPQVDPELFWSDQIRDAGTRRVPKPGPPLSVHGFRANQVSVTVAGEPVIVASSIDTGDQTFLVAVSAGTPDAANTRFARLIQTFDPR